MTLTEKIKRDLIRPHRKGSARERPDTVTSRAGAFGPLVSETRNSAPVAAKSFHRIETPHTPMESGFHRHKEWYESA